MSSEDVETILPAIANDDLTGGESFCRLFLYLNRPKEACKYFNNHANKERDAEGKTPYSGM